MSTTSRSQNGCLGIFLRVFGIQASSDNERRVSAKSTGRRRKIYPYRLRDAFLSSAELSFYHVLRTVVGERAIILSKVRLWDIFYVVRPDKHRGAISHIDRKHVDFLLCDPKTMQPVAAIELDDSSHQKAKRRLRDAEVDVVFETAGLPLVRLPAQRAYKTGEVAAKLAPYLAKAPTSNLPLEAVQTDGAPLCPKCGIPMVRRVAVRGARKGEQFYGCPNFPDCKSVLPVEQS